MPRAGADSSQQQRLRRLEITMVPPKDASGEATRLERDTMGEMPVPVEIPYAHTHPHMGTSHLIRCRAPTYKWPSVGQRESPF